MAIGSYFLDFSSCNNFNSIFDSANSYLETNFDSSAIAFIDVYDPTGFEVTKSLLKLPGKTSIKFVKSDLFNIPSKLIARLYNTDGVFWADDFILQDGVVNIEFQSQGESSESGELKTFNGSLTQDGQPVSRAVYALAIGGDVPKLLASAVSDDMGNYSLEWNGYTGQILVTATDDYGAPFAAEALLSIGARVHPATPNGYIYEAASAGTLGLEEPAWPAIEGESVASGQVQLVAKPFYRPKSAGPFTIV
jgi:hypothetical protein